jgi:hypothetical protein
MVTADTKFGPPARAKHRRRLRLFFVYMVAAAVVILSLAFVPEAIDFARGTLPIPFILHVHAAIMAAWVAGFAVQAYLAVKGKIVQHQRAGEVTYAIAWLAWASMVFVEWRAIVAHPLPEELPPYDELLAGPYIYLTFPIFLAWAYRERRRPMWHKRLMLFALFLSLGAAVQRYAWLPMYRAHAGYWPIIAFTDLVLLLPLIAFDLVTLRRRLHPSTTHGMLVLFATQAIMLSLWGTAAWRGFAYNLSHAFHRVA